MYKVALYGIGQGYNDFVSYRGYEQVNVTVLVDRSAFCERLDGVKVVNPQTFIDEYLSSVDYIIVTVQQENLYLEILHELLGGGVSRDIVFPLRIFKIAYFDFNRYVQIKKSKVSIISDFCFSAFLYHMFAFEHNSPTINMFCYNDDYYRFLQKLSSGY